MNEKYTSRLHLLNEAQRAAVDFDFCENQKSLLLLAGAGSGKTTVLSLKVVSEYLGGLALNEMCCITFTVKASEEMKSRISTFLDPQKVNLDDLQVSTFHSLAWKIISSQVGGVYGYALLGYASVPVLDNKEGSNYLELDALVPQALKLLKMDVRFCDFWRKRCRLLLVDEYQDVSPDQIDFCKVLKEDGSYLFAVGDDDQAVYHFRGAEPRSIIDFSNDFLGSKLIKLELNYRSQQVILDKANFLFKDKDPEFKKVLTSAMAPSQSYASSYKINPPKMRWFSNAFQEVNSVLEKIVDLNSKGVLNKDIAVLARTNRMVEYFSHALKELGLGEGVHFLTIHGAKGLEWEAVFVVGLGQGLFPLERKSLVEREEETRLFYVAITRAKSFLFVSGAKSRVWMGKKQVYKLGALPKLAGFSKLSRWVDFLWR